MDIIIIAVAVLGGIGVVGAASLWAVSRRFHVSEDPRIAEIESLLPGANCGACGRSGCHDFAVACSRASSLDDLRCPGAGDDGMARIAEILGLAAVKGKPMVAVVKCAGDCEMRPRKVVWDGAMSCAVASGIAAGEGGCPQGCLGCGDCVSACRWDAITIDKSTGLPVIDEDKCTACGECAKACPRSVIEIRAKGPRGMRVWVACNNRERGPEAMKACKVSCIACGKCVKTCTHDAVTVSNNLAWIDPDKCKLCRKCVDACPRNAIHTVNFPLRQPAPAQQ